MYQPNRTKWPRQREPDYAVYVDQSGLYRPYLSRRKELLAQPNYGPALYDFTSDLVRRPKLKPRLTVESIIRMGYFAAPKSDPVEAIISDKMHTSRLGLDDIIGQIRDRYQTFEQNVYEIEISKCAVNNSLHMYEAYHGPANSKIEYSVNKRLDELYIDQRKERITLWRDVSKLKLLLPENAQLYLATYRKSAILRDQTGDLP